MKTNCEALPSRTKNFSRVGVLLSCCSRIGRNIFLARYALLILSAVLDSSKMLCTAHVAFLMLAELLKERSYFSVVAEKAAETIDATITAATQLFSGSKAESTAVASVKPKVVILGAGWASHSFLQAADASRFDICCVSSRMHFLYTPMLAASAVGTVEFRSIAEPIRNANPDAKYLEATCTAIDTASKKITCENVVCAGTSCTIESFDLPYDHLIVAVGATSNTFGIPGVREHCIFMKQVTDADKLRTAIGMARKRL